MKKLFAITEDDCQVLRDLTENIAENGDVQSVYNRHPGLRQWAGRIKDMIAKGLQPWVEIKDDAPTLAELRAELEELRQGRTRRMTGREVTDRIVELARLLDDSIRSWSNVSGSRAYDAHSGELVEMTFDTRVMVREVELQDREGDSLLHGRVRREMKRSEALQERLNALQESFNAKEAECEYLRGKLDESTDREAKSRKTEERMRTRVKELLGCNKELKSRLDAQPGENDEIKVFIERNDELMTENDKLRKAIEEASANGTVIEATARANQYLRGMLKVTRTDQDKTQKKYDEAKEMLAEALNENGKLTVKLDDKRQELSKVLLRNVQLSKYEEKFNALYTAVRLSGTLEQTTDCRTNSTSYVFKSNDRKEFEKYQAECKRLARELKTFQREVEELRTLREAASEYLVIHRWRKPFTENVYHYVVEPK